MDLEVAPMTLELFHQPATNHHPHTLVCRRQPESAIAKSIRPPSWIGDGRYIMGRRQPRVAPTTSSLAGIPNL